MKHYIRLFAAALCFGTFVLPTETSYAQNKLKILPILTDEAPKVQAIKNDNSLSKIQKMQQIRAIHQQTDPQMKAILSPAQYQKLQAIRQQAIKNAVQTY